MDLSPAQRVVAFLGIVVVLGGMGAYLLIPGVRSALGQGHGAAAATPGASPSGGRGTSPAVPAASTAPATPASPVPTGSAPDIYQWLPFTAAELARAAAVATRFGALYDTFSYTETTAHYLQKMRNVTTGQLSGTLARAYATPGIAGPRARAKEVSVGSASIRSLRAFGSASITFIVSISQKITDTRGVRRNTGQYAVTVTGSGASWQVSDIQLASAGNS